MDSFTKVNLIGTGFTGINVWNKTIDDIFKSASKTENFLHMTITSTNSEYRATQSVSVWTYQAYS